MKITESGRVNLGHLVCLAALMLTVVISRAAPSTPGDATRPAAIPADQIGTVAGKAYRGEGLAVVSTSGGARLRCDFQQLEARATPEGLWIHSTDPDAIGERLRVLAVALKRGTSQPTTPGELASTGTVTVAGSMARFSRPGLTEEYTVSMDGIRQDFLVEHRPAGEGDLRLELSLDGARAESSRKGVRLTLEGSGRQLAYGRLRVVDAHGRDLTARMEVLGESRLAVTVKDESAAYPVRIDPTFSDDDWGSMGGILGADSWVYAAVADAAGNLYLGGNFEMVGDVRVNHVARWDGSEWSDLGGGVDWEVWALAVSGTDLYVGGDFSWAGKTGTEPGIPVNRIARWDGAAWSALGSGIGVEAGPNVWDYVAALAVSGTDVYAGGSFRTAGGTQVSNVARWDGSAWSALGSGTDDEVYALAVIGTDVYAGGAFTSAGGIEANSIARWDGSSWSALGAGMDDDVYALATMGTDLYVGGDFSSAGGAPANHIARWDGSSWSAVGSGVNDRVSALAVSGTDLYAGGWFSTAGTTSGAYYVAKWADNRWSALGRGVDDVVTALAVVGNTVFVGGDFELIGGEIEISGGVPTLVNRKVAYYVGRWNGSDWSALGSVSGLSGTVRALAVMGTTLYAGGTFSTASVNPANNIARWDGRRWQALGSGIDGTVSALEVDGTDLYVGGYFRKAGGIDAVSVARWNGSTWSPMGTGLNNAVVTFAKWGTNLYAGGHFTGVAPGETVLTGIARWDGTEWTAVGGGVLGSVLDLAVSETRLYAGGVFQEAGGTAASSIAQWDGNAWSAMGSGMDSQVYALAMVGPDLYAAGVFSTAGGVPVNSIARWNGSSWFALGSGVSEGSAVLSLAAAGTDLYVGGSFPTAGGQPARAIAMWDGTTWSALGSGADGEIHALAVLGSELFAGGDFISIGNRVSPSTARARIRSAPVGGGRLGDWNHSPAAGLSFTFLEGVVGQSYRVQSAPVLDANAWTDVSRFTYAGPVVITEPVTTDPAPRFYRVVSP